MYYFPIDARYKNSYIGSKCSTDDSVLTVEDEEYFKLYKPLLNISGS